MRSWLVKALVQRAIGALPWPHFWNELLQERVTHSLHLTADRFEASLRNCRNHLEQLACFGAPAKRGAFSAFELGTGWFPTVAIALYLCGAREVWTWDIASLLKRERLKHTMRRFLDLEHKPILREHVCHEPDRLGRLRELMALCEDPRGPEPAAILERLGIHYRNGNASQSNLPSHSVDLILSDVVLEYLSSQQLSEVMQEFRRIAASDAVMSHTIGLFDQYAAYDPQISAFNFLRYSDRTWRLLNNPIIPLNRLRISDYREAVSKSGFRIVHEDSERGDPADLARTPLAKPFNNYAIEDLLVINTWLVAVPQLGAKSSIYEGCGVWTQNKESLALSSGR
jgi:hypothetical protein